MRLTGIGFAASIAFAVAFIASTVGVSAEPYKQGPKVCEECHRSEVEVWEGTQHFASFKTVHKSDLGKKVIKAIGEKSMKKSEVCTQCHYTMVQKDADAKAKPKAGPSCESCHGASSDWFKIHNDYGGAGVKREDETPEHKAERIAAAAAAGMNWPHDKYGVAENCNECHGLANPNIPGETLAAMLDAGHPTVPDWELVRYSQGTVRHRFYPPNMTENAVMTPAELAELYVIGQAAKLVSATQAMGQSDSPKYKEFQEARAAAAKEALGAVSAAADLIANPTEETARALIDSIKGTDLSGEVGPLLPSPDSYK